MQIKSYIEEVKQEVDATSNRFKNFMDTSIVIHPIPFFGRVDRAKVLTVGVNPSAGEFAKSRGWPIYTDTETLTQRLLGYFENPTTPSHPWFDVWKKALKSLGVSYEDGTAAHVDISPRATRSMSQVDPDGFLEMVRHDVRWLFKLLGSLDSSRLLLMAGCVTKKRYINHFLRECSPQRGWMLSGESQNSGRGRIGYHKLTSRTTECNFPAFFCSVSPSSRNEADKELLIQRVEENRGQLTSLI